MSFSSRISTGWTLAKASFGIIKKHKSLLLLPVFSGIAMIITTGSFLLILFAGLGWETTQVFENSTTMDYILAFLFYLVNYFVIIFFNMALIHCVRLYFAGEEVSLEQGLKFSLSRISDILAWSVLAATVGLIFKVIEEYLGRLGEIISGLLGMVWSITTFFVVPIIAYEKLNPLQALKRSTSIMKEKWGESLAATFGFGFIKFFGLLLISVPLFILGGLINLVVGITLGVLSAFLIFAIVSAAEVIFIGAVYQRLRNEPVTDFDVNTLDAAFIRKS